LEGRPPPVVDR
jgi:fused signal recognition particle receptor